MRLEEFPTILIFDQKINFFFYDIFTDTLSRSFKAQDFILEVKK